MKHILNFTTKNVFIFIITFTCIVFSSCNNDDNSTQASMSSVRMKNLPKVNYVLGEKLDLSDLVISIDKNSSVVDVPFASFGAENITTVPTDGTVLDFSHQQITITIGDTGNGLIQPISVTNNVVALEVKNNATDKYVEGQKLDLSGMIVSLIKEDATKVDVGFDDFGTEIQTLPIHGDVLSVADTEVKVTYVATNAKIAQDIQVIPFAPLSGIVTTPPIKSEYDVGERLDLEGTVLTYSMPEDLNVIVSFEDFEAFKLTTSPANETKLIGTNTAVEISHATGVLVTLPITVNKLGVTGMDIETKPEKTLYADGELINLKGLTLKLSINGKEDLIVSSEDFDVYKITTTPEEGTMFVAGTTEIVITYPDFADTVSIPLGSETIYESNFSEGIDGWTFNQNGGGSVNVSAEEGILIAKEIVPGANPWDVQLYKASILLEEGAKYKLTTIVKAYPGQGDFWFSLSVGDGTGRDGWVAYDGGGGIMLGDTEYKTYEKEFIMGKETTNGARILFDIGNQTNGIMVQYVKLEKL